METQIFLFYALAIGGSLYFVLGRSVFDFVSIGFFGQLIYFLPGFVGYVANPYFPGLLPSVPIVEESYRVWNFCLGGTLVTGLLYRPARRDAGELRTSFAFDIGLLGLIVGAAAVSFLVNGPELLSTDKNDVLDNIDRIFLLFASTCQVAMICFAIQRKWAFALIPALGLVFLLYAGFRAEFALSLIAVLAYIARHYGLFVFLQPRYLAISLMSAAILLAYKPFLTAYRVGNWRVLDTLQMSDNLWETLVLQFEPFLTQAVLNEVLARQFQVSAGSLFDSLVAFVPFLAPAIGMKPEEISFNFQDVLFPNIAYGMTGSPQAQFYAALGWGGLFLFVALHNLLLVWTSRGLETDKPARLIFSLGVGAFFAFYLQRNDLGNSLTLVNRVLIVVVLAWLASWLMSAGRSAAAPPRNAGEGTATSPEGSR